MTREVVAPWQAWIAAFAIAQAAVIAAWFVATEVGPPQDRLFVEYNRDRIARFRAAASPGAGTVVLMIGSSVFKYATRGELDFAHGISSATGRPVRVLRLVSNGGTFTNLMPLREDLKALHADLLVIQQDQLILDRPRWLAFGIWLARVRVHAGVVPPLAGWTLENEHWVQVALPCWKRKHARSVEAHLELQERLVAARPTGPAAEAARELVEATLASGGRVAFVDLPRRPDYDAVARPARDQAMDGEQFAGLRSRVEYWSHGPLDSGKYCDVAHMNQDGQRVFSDWLESQVAGELSRGSDRVSVSGFPVGATPQRLHAH